MIGGLIVRCSQTGKKIHPQLENISSENVTSLKEKDLTKGVDLMMDSNGKTYPVELVEFTGNTECTLIQSIICCCCFHFVDDKSTRTKPKSLPSKERSTMEPAKERSTMEPAKERSTMEPAKERSTMEPAKERSTMEPAKERSTMEPAKNEYHDAGVTLMG